MQQTYSFKEKGALFIKLFIPMLITQCSLFAATFVSVFLTGQYSTVDLAGVSIGYNIWVSVFTGLLGLLLGIMPILSQLLGAQKKETIPTLIQHGLSLSFALSVFIIIVGFFSLEPFLNMLSLEPAVHRITVEYMIAIGISIPAILAVCILRNAVDAHGYTHYSTTIMLLSFVLNVLMNYLFIFGYGSIPAMGGIGSGYAFAISSWFNLLGFSFIFLFLKPFADYKLFSQIHPFTFLYWRDLLQLGVPIGIAIFCEVSIFSIAAFLMAKYGTAFIAAHQAALSVTNIFYCVPLTISMTATIVVAYEVGAERFKDAKEYAKFARIFAIVLAVFISSFGFLNLDKFAALYTNDENMVSLIAKFLAYALFFSVIDAFGTPLQGILRGYKDVKVITYIAIACYWGVCLPVALILSNMTAYGPYGIWIGLLSGILVAGILYTIRLYYIQNKLPAFSEK